MTLQLRRIVEFKKIHVLAFGRLQIWYNGMVIPFLKMF